MRCAVLALLLTPLAAAQPDTHTVDLGDGATLHVVATRLDATADRVRVGDDVFAVGDCDAHDRLVAVQVLGGAVRGAAIRSAVVVIERPGGRRDSVRLQTDCLFPPVSDGEIDLHLDVAPASLRSPLSGGWRLSHGVGDGDGYAGDWVVGLGWDAHRSGAPAPFTEADDAPSAERLHTELTLLVEGVRAQKLALRACAEAASNRVCSNPDVLRAHAQWLDALERWSVVAAAFRP